MYAVIQTGGKQYRVEPGKTIMVEKLEGDAGAKVVFDQVLLVSSGDGASVTVGKPTVAGAKVTGEIVEQDARRQARRVQVPPPQELRPQERSPPGSTRRSRSRRSRPKE